MKSGLLVLQTLGEFPARLIQVATPENGISEHIHKDYDVETLWELDEDNRDGAANRCSEVKCPTLSKIKKEEIIKSIYPFMIIRQRLTLLILFRRRKIRGIAT